MTADAGASPRPEPARAVRAAVDSLAVALRPHGGGLVLESLDDGPGGATVRLRFTGMCAGCPARPLCHDQTVAPVLRSLPGVAEVVAPGTRVDAAAAARLRRMFAPPGPGPDPYLPRGGGQ